MKKALNAIKKVFYIIIGIVAVVFNYIVYALDCILIAPFPRSTPAFKYWNNQEPYIHNFKKYAYIRMGFFAVLFIIYKLF